MTKKLNPKEIWKNWKKWQQSEGLLITTAGRLRGRASESNKSHRGMPDPCENMAPVWPWVQAAGEVLWAKKEEILPTFMMHFSECKNTHLPVISIGGCGSQALWLWKWSIEANTSSRCMNKAVKHHSPSIPYQFRIGCWSTLKMTKAHFSVLLKQRQTSYAGCSNWQATKCAHTFGHQQKEQPAVAGGRVPLVVPSCLWVQPFPLRERQEYAVPHLH